MVVVDAWLVFRKDNVAAQAQSTPVTLRQFVVKLTSDMVQEGRKLHLECNMGDSTTLSQVQTPEKPSQIPSPAESPCTVTHTNCHLDIFGFSDKPNKNGKRISIQQKCNWCARNKVSMKTAYRCTCANIALCSPRTKRDCFALHLLNPHIKLRGSKLDYEEADEC